MPRTAGSPTRACGTATATAAARTSARGRVSCTSPTGTAATPRRLTRDEGEVGSIAWAPDGSRLLFSSDRNLPDANSDEVYSVAPDGSCLTWLTNGAPGSSDASWRPGSGDSLRPAQLRPEHPPARATRRPTVDRYWATSGPARSTDSLLLTDSLQRPPSTTATASASDGCPTVVLPVRRLRVAGPDHRAIGWPCGAACSSAISSSSRARIVFGGRRATYARARAASATFKQALKIVDEPRADPPRAPRHPARARSNRLDAEQKAKLRPYRVCGRA